MSTVLLCFAAVAEPLPAASGNGISPLLVLVGLGVVWYYLHRIAGGLDRIGNRLARAAPAPSASAAAAVAPPPVRAAVPVEQAIPSETVAVIAAAVHAALGQPVRIVAIADTGDSLRTWSMEGRRQIFASHQIR